MHWDILLQLANHVLSGITRSPPTHSTVVVAASFPIANSVQPDPSATYALLATLYHFAILVQWGISILTVPLVISDTTLTQDYAVPATSSALIAANVPLPPPVNVAMQDTSLQLAQTAHQAITHLMFHRILALFAPK